MQPWGNSMKVSRLAVICTIHILLSLYFSYLAWPDQDKLFTPDSQGYDGLATNLIAHQAFSQDSQPPFEPEVFRTPVYPFFLATCYAIFGHRPFAVVFVQIGLNLAIMLIVFRIGRILFDRQASYWGCALLALSGVFILNARYLLTETLFTFILASIMYLLVWLTCSGDNVLFRLSRKTAVPASVGILLGLLTLCRPNGFYLLAVVNILILLLLGRGRYGFRAKARSIAIISMCFALVIMPWIARNWYHFGSVRIDTGQSIALYFITVGSMQARENGSSLEKAVAIRRAQETDIEHLNPLELAAKRQRAAMEEILANPYNFAVVYLYGLAVTLSPISPKALALYLGDGKLSSSSAAELGALIQHGSFAESIPFILRSFDDLNWSIWLSSLFFIVLDLGKYWLCILAVVLFYNSGKSKIGLFLLLPIIAYFILITGPMGPEATFRYRAPVDPYISLLAGSGLGGISRTWSGFRDRRLLLSLIGFLVFCLVVGSLRLFFSISMV
jgi:4-amino-4-deoxy-L-arabinose transferase-like glycosyltransferase